MSDEVAQVGQSLSSNPSHKESKSGINNGDCVYHVDRPWPWCGIVRAVHPVCSSCDKPKKSDATALNNYPSSLDDAYSDDADCVDDTCCWSHEDASYLAAQSSSSALSAQQQQQQFCSCSEAAVTSAEGQQLIAELKDKFRELFGVDMVEEKPVAVAIVEGSSSSSKPPDSPAGDDNNNSGSWHKQFAPSEREQMRALLVEPLAQVLQPLDAHTNRQQLLTHSLNQWEQSAFYAANSEHEYTSAFEGLVSRLKQFVSALKNINKATQTLTESSGSGDEKTAPKVSMTVQWYPSSEVTHGVPAEKLRILSRTSRTCRNVNGTSVQLRSATGPQARLGIVKQLCHTANAVVLPNCDYVLTNITDPNRIRPLHDFISHGASFVWYKGWLGMPYSVFNRFKFKTDDGYEFTLNEEDLDGVTIKYQDCMVKSKQQTRHMLYNMYPGQRVRFPVESLNNRWTRWLTDDGEPPEHIAGLCNSHDTDNNSDDDVPESPPRRKTGVRFKLWPFDASKPDGEHRDKAVLSPTHGPDIIEEFESIMFDKQQKAKSGRSVSCTQSHGTQTDASCLYVTATVLDIAPVGMDVEWQYKVGRHPDDKSTSRSKMNGEVEPLGDDAVMDDDCDDECSIALFSDSDDQDPEERYVGEKEILTDVRAYSHSVINGGGFCGPRIGTVCRYTVDEQDEFWPTDLYRQSSSRPHCKPFEPGQQIYIYMLWCSESVTVMWEDGEWQEGIASQLLVPAAFSHGHSHDPQQDVQFFPGMYVQWDDKKPGVEAAGKSEVGRVLSASNSERCAKIEWLDSHTQTNVSFYDIVPKHEYNFLSGTMVQRLNGTDAADKPNLGHVHTKLADGSLLVRWFGDTADSVINPQLIRKLKNAMTGRSDAGSVASGDYNEDPALYSPTQYEANDLRNVDYSWCVSLRVRDHLLYIVSAVCCSALPLVRLAAQVHARYPLMQRNSLLHVCSSLNGILCGLLYSGQATVKQPLLARIRQLNAKCACHTMQPQTDSSQDKPCTTPPPSFVAALEGAVELVKLEAPPHAVVAREKDKDMCESCSRAVSAITDLSRWLYDFIDVHDTYQNSIKKHNLLKPADDQNGPGKKFPKADSPYSYLKLEVDTSNDCLPCFNTFVKLLQERTRRFDDNYETLVCGLQQLQLGPDGRAASEEEQLEMLRNLYDSLSLQQAASATEPDLALDCVQQCVAFAQWLDSPSDESVMCRLPCFDWCLPPAAALKRLAPELTEFDVDDGQQPKFVLPDQFDAMAAIAQLLGHIRARVDKQFKADGKYRMPVAQVPEFNRCMGDALALVCLVTSVDMMQHVHSGVTADGSLSFALSSKQESAMETDADAAAAAAEDAAEPPAALDLSAEEHSLCPDAFQMVACVPAGHRFGNKATSSGSAPARYMKVVRNELKLLHTSLPPGIFVRGYEDRMDLFSCMIVGPRDTPYEHCLFVFDARLPDDYPNRPPHVFFKSKSKSLNPNLYEDGMVCLSLLGTWEGNANELWSPSKSNLLQVFLSIMGLVLVDEPFFLEPGWENDRNTERGKRDCRPYNEGVILHALESLEKLVISPEPPFEQEIEQHFLATAPALMRLLDKYADEPESVPFTLCPVTQGFRLCVQRHRATIAGLLQRKQQPPV